MTGCLTLLARELRRRLPAHAVSLGLGLIAIAAPWLQADRSPAHLGELRGAGAVGLAALWALALALVEGQGFLAGDLRERRLGFDFRLPVTGAAIWAARAAGALLSVSLAAALPPTLARLAGADLYGALAGVAHLVESGRGVELAAPLLTAGLILVLLLFSLDFVGLALASRSPWIGLDLATVAIFKTLALVTAFCLWRAFDEEGVGLALLLALAVGVLGIGAASWWQVVRGRTEPDRAHRAFSLVLLIVTLGGGLALRAWGAWRLAPAPSDLQASTVVATPVTKDLVWLTGAARNRGPLQFGFLFEPGTGRARLAGRSSEGLTWYAAKASLDGSTLAWLGVERRALEVSTTIVSLGHRAELFSGESNQPLSWSGHPISWALSPDGSHIASVWRGKAATGGLRVEVDELSGGTPAQDLALRDCRDFGRLLFVSERRLFYACGTALPADLDPRARRLSLDLADGSVQVDREIPLFGRPLDARMARTPERSFEPVEGEPAGPPSWRARLEVLGRDAREVAAPASKAPAASAESARFLRRNGLAVVWSDGTRQSLALYDPEGRLADEIPLAWAATEILGEIEASGDLLLGTTDRPRPTQRTMISIQRLSIADRKVTQVAADLVASRPDSASTPTTVFQDAQGKWWWLDLERGDLTPLLARL